VRLTSTSRPEADRVRDAYSDATYARLVALKDRYDPANLFRLNQNIRPSRAAAESASRVLA
jgi:FAD/FMN-containing dehydrogenase